MKYNRDGLRYDSYHVLTQSKCRFANVSFDWNQFFQLALGVEVE